MKNSEVVSAVIGGSFFAIPYLALNIPILPSLAIGTLAFTAGELVFRKGKTLKESNLTLYETLENAKKQNKHILEMIPKIENIELRKSLNEINTTVTKIINTIEKNPEKEKKLKNFFDYYLPVTVKLVDRYDEIENQKINSKEEKSFNLTTEKTIKEINDVFKQFLNILYQSDMNDTDVEIKVLNSMLKADGLSKNELNVEEGDHE